MRTSFLILFLCLLPWNAVRSEELHKDHSYFELIADKIEQIRYYRGTEARKLLVELYEIAGQYKNDGVLYARCLYLETMINHAQGSRDMEVRDRITARKELVGENDLLESALLDYSLAMAFLSENNYPESFQVALYVCEKFVKINNDKYISKSFILLGNICSHMRNFKMAEQYYYKALEYLEPTQIGYYLTQANIAMAQSFITNDQQATIDVVLKLIEPMKSFGDPCVLALAYLNLGDRYLELENLQKAKEHQEKCLDLIPEIDNGSIVFSLYHNVGNYHHNLGEHDRALEYFRMSYNNALEDANDEFLLFSAASMTAVYDKLGNIDSAYFYLQKYNELNNKIINYSELIETYQSYVSMVLDSAEKELKIAEQAIGLKNRTLIALTIFFIALITVIGLILIILQQKRQKQMLIKETENKKLSEHLENEKKIQRLQKEQLEEKIREVSSYSLLLYNKNNIIQQVSTLLKQVPQQSKDIESINRIIEANFNSEQDWDNFILHFEKVHPDFFTRLKAHCHKLTNNNLRLCAYFRIGLTTKEICQILNVSPETVKSNRRRLKRLMGLSESDSLRAFLEGI